MTDTAAQSRGDSKVGRLTVRGEASRWVAYRAHRQLLGGGLRCGRRGAGGLREFGLARRLLADADRWVGFDGQKRM